MEDIKEFIGGKIPTWFIKYRESYDLREYLEHLVELQGKKNAEKWIDENKMKPLGLLLSVERERGEWVNNPSVLINKLEIYYERVDMPTFEMSWRDMNDDDNSELQKTTLAPGKNIYKGAQIFNYWPSEIVTSLIWDDRSRWMFDSVCSILMGGKIIPMYPKDPDRMQRGERTPLFVTLRIKDLYEIHEMRKLMLDELMKIDPRKRKWDFKDEQYVVPVVV